MKFKEMFPSAALVHGILFVRVADLLQGREYLDDQNAHLLRRGLRVLREMDFEIYALSFRDLTYVSSQAIGDLVEFQKRLGSSDRRLLIYELPPKLKIVLAELGLDRLFDIYGLHGHVLRFFQNGDAAT